MTWRERSLLRRKSWADPQRATGAETPVIGQGTKPPEDGSLSKCVSVVRTTIKVLLCNWPFCIYAQLFHLIFHYNYIFLVDFGTFVSMKTRENTVQCNGLLKSLLCHTALFTLSSYFERTDNNTMKKHVEVLKIKF